MAAIFRAPRTRAEGLRLALERKLGERVVLAKRISDMCASGFLVPYPYDD